MYAMFVFSLQIGAQVLLILKLLCVRSQNAKIADFCTILIIRVFCKFGFQLPIQPFAVDYRMAGRLGLNGDADELYRQSR
jgi:hypothetical protein